MGSNEAVKCRLVSDGIDAVFPRLSLFRKSRFACLVMQLSSFCGHGRFTQPHESYVRGLYVNVFLWLCDTTSEYSFFLFCTISLSVNNKEDPLLCSV